MDLEPVIAAPEGAFVIDARVRVQAAERMADVPRVGHRPRELPRIR